jgi:hypothetical protein
VNDIYRHDTQVSSHDLLKILALSTIIIDHIGKYFFIDSVWWRVVGRMAAPQFFFLVGYSESYKFKSQLLFYGLALCVVNYLTSPSTSIVEHFLPINMLIGFVLIKALLNRFDPAKLPAEFLMLLLAVLMLLSLPTYILIEYGTLAFCYAIGARLVRQRHGFRYFWIIATVVVHFFFELVIVLIRNLDVSISLQLLPAAIALLAVVFGANLIIFLNYDFRVFKAGPKFIRTLAIYISRYYLQIYFFHLAAFMIIYYI